MNNNLQAIIRTAHISLARAMDGDQNAFVAARFNLDLALESLSDDKEERKAQRIAQVADEEIDEGRLGVALVYLKRADHWLE
ncbi:MAG: hypothetical protein OXI72_10980 [Gemmatimonadota bacterium]|nr:hypothetical protein [Gemmatimonadota bacterium]